MRFIARHGGEEIPIEVERHGSAYRVRMADRWLVADVVNAGPYLRSLRLEDGTQLTLVHDRDGTFTGLRGRIVCDGGAYPGIGAFLPYLTRTMSQGVYRIPSVQMNSKSAITNTTPKTSGNSARTFSNTLRPNNCQPER